MSPARTVKERTFEVRPLTNWAGNIEFGTAQVHLPTSVEQVRQLVAAGPKVRAVGSGHSFSPIADTAHILIGTARLPSTIAIDTRRRRVRVGAGARYAELAAALHARGYALHNMASLPHISVAGSVATGTHGSGEHNAGLAAAVTSVDLVTADGETVTISRDRDAERWPGAVVSLGTLGIVTAVELEMRPAFQMRQHVFDGLPLAELDEHFDRIAGAAYSVSMFTDWRTDRFNQVWLKQRADEPAVSAEPTWFGARPATAPRHPIPGADPTACTEQLGAVGPWHERLPHFRAEFTPSAGDELQSEYLVPRASGVAAVRALAAVADRIAPVLQICEVRTIAADGQWLSPCYDRDTVGLHFTWVKDLSAVEPVLKLIEQQLAEFDARPHWGKLFAASPREVASRYERLGDFTALARRLDPGGKFSNEFTDRYLFGVG